MLAALGDSLLGPSIADALSLDRDTARQLAAAGLRFQLDEAHPKG